MLCFKDNALISFNVVKTFGSIWCRKSSWRLFWLQWCGNASNLPLLNWFLAKQHWPGGSAACQTDADPKSQVHPWQYVSIWVVAAWAFSCSVLQSHHPLSQLITQLHKCQLKRSLLTAGERMGKCNISGVNQVKSLQLVPVASHVVFVAVSLDAHTRWSTLRADVGMVCNCAPGGICLEVGTDGETAAYWAQLRRTRVAEESFILLLLVHKKCICCFVHMNKAKQTDGTCSLYLLGCCKPVLQLYSKYKQHIGVVVGCFALHRSMKVDNSSRSTCTKDL